MLRIEDQLKEYRAKKRREDPTRVKPRVVKPRNKFLSLFFPIMSSSKKEEEVVLLEDDIDITSETSDCMFEEKHESWKYFAIKWTLCAVIWLALFMVFLKLQFGAVFFVISLLVGICLNTRTGPKPPGEKSAYSVFNRNCESIHGTTTAEQFEREIRFGPGSVM